MCSISKKDCTLTTIKLMAILLVLNLILTAIGIEYSPLYWIANFSYDSLPLVQGTELLNSNVEKWGIRGQIGDIMSGHFSALAVLAVAYSITLQVEANKKMTESIEKQEKALAHQRESIEKQTEANLEQAQNTLQQAKAIELQAQSIKQQNEALKVQSKALESQIEELKASREESKRQTEEFFIQNINVKLDRYYRLLNNHFNIIFTDDLKQRVKYLNNINQIECGKKTDEKYYAYRINVYAFLPILEDIYMEIKTIKNIKIKKFFINEFRLKLKVDHIISTLTIHCTDKEKETYTFLRECDYNYYFPDKIADS